jgi:hypothetical protein
VNAVTPSRRDSLVFIPIKELDENVGNAHRRKTREGSSVRFFCVVEFCAVSAAVFGAENIRT